MKKVTLSPQFLHRKAIVPPLCLAAFLLSTSSASAFSLSANAGVNLVGTVSDQSTTPGTSVSATFTTPNGLATATASADSDLTLKTFARSTGFALSQPAQSSAGTSQVSYTILGNDAEIILPLTFNYRLTGSLTSNPGDFVSGAGFQYGIISPVGNIGGSANATFQRFGSSLIAATSASGFLGPNITLGTNTLSQQTNFDFAIPITVVSNQGIGLLITTLVSSATATPNTNSLAISDFSSNGLRLESVTVPADFNSLSLDNLRVLFDTGRSVQVTRAGGSGGSSDGGNSGDGSAAVPEPTTITGLSLAAVGLVRLRQRKRQRSQ